jgi:2-iminobutanoate/2-iminopropanoate deaminase
MREIVSTDKARRSKSPLTQAVKTETLVFVSGQLGGPADGSPLAVTIEGQTRLALENMKAILEAAGSSLANVVKTTVFVTNIEAVPRVNRVYEEYFSPDPPARSAVAVAALAGGALVEIEAVAVLSSD